MASGRSMQMGPGLWVEPPTAPPDDRRSSSPEADYFGLVRPSAAHPHPRSQVYHQSDPRPTPDTPRSDSSPASPDPLLPPSFSSSSSSSSSFSFPSSPIPKAERQRLDYHHHEAAKYTPPTVPSALGEVENTGAYVAPGDNTLLGLVRVISRRLSPWPSHQTGRPSLSVSPASAAAAAAATETKHGFSVEAGSPTSPIGTPSQGVPPELGSFAAECLLVLVCSVGQCFFAMSLGQVMVPQTLLRDALGIAPTQAPWLVGSSLLASGLSVIIAGSLADLAPPKPLMIGAFVWQAAWNGASAACISSDRRILFFVSRAMQGLAMGVTVSASMSILGRIYNPGRRKTRVFSVMAATSPLGFWLGCMQGGALAYRLPWIFGTSAVLHVCCAAAAQLSLPWLRPACDGALADAPSLRQFDWAGAALSSAGSGLLIFGLTQGSVAHWNPYTYSCIAAGLLCFAVFALVERRIARPLIPNGLWHTRGFVALLVAFFLGFGGFNGGWQFYAVQFWQRFQGASPLTTGLYVLPNCVGGIIATWVVSLTLHRYDAHWIFAASMVCYALGPVFFLPQTAHTSYWALSMPGVFLSCFGPDMSFAAAAIFVTSSVPRSYQGAAGSLLVTAQNLAGAIMTSAADSIGVRVEQLPSGEVGLEGIRAAWWFGFACAMTGFVITCLFVRIPKAEEMEHVQ